MKEVDVSIVGGGPAGLQAALVLARTRKKIVVYDASTAPRNGASHGVHNVLGLDGLLPAEIREQAWSQIDEYQHAELIRDRVDNISLDSDGTFILSSENIGPLRAKRVIVASGFDDKYPDVEGFSESWGDTIIPCPFCDGYENRDRIWGLVANSELQATHFPALVNNWTTSAKLILNYPDPNLDTAFQVQMHERGIHIHSGKITHIVQMDGKVKSVILHTGEAIEVETLWWVPERQKSSLEKKIIQTFQLELNEMGLIKSNDNGQTDIKGLYAVGDLAQMPPSALGAMVGGNTAALSIVREWFN